jgi:TonB family protein
MSYRTKRGFLLTALMLTALNLCVRAQGTSTVAASSPVTAATNSADSDRARDGLSGPVRRVRTEIVKLSNKSAKMTEGQRALLETAAYDIKGSKSENAYYPVAGETLTGREVYKYDEKGNISEMTLHAPDGSLISKETYTYEFDLVGNWVKMTASVAVIEGGKLSFEPTEITYRTITYYLDENMARMVQPGQTTTAAPSSTPAEAHATAKTEPANATSAAGGNKTGATVRTQVGALPTANALDKTNLVTTANRGGEMPGDVSTNSAVVKVDAGGEPPSKPTPRPLTKPVSGGVLNGSAVDLPKPLYPEMAKRASASGTVTVEVVIDETGKVVSARATSGHPLLKDAAVKAALRARFSPTKLSGQPVKIAGLLYYNFSMNQ